MLIPSMDSLTWKQIQYLKRNLVIVLQWLVLLT